MGARNLGFLFPNLHIVNRAIAVTILRVDQPHLHLDVVRTEVGRLLVLKLKRLHADQRSSIVGVQRYRERLIGGRAHVKGCRLESVCVIVSGKAHLLKVMDKRSFR